jgi:hypothetical protein
VSKEPSTNIVTHPLVKDIWSQKSYVIDYKFFDDPNIFYVDEWFQLTRFKYMKPETPGTFHRSRTIYRKVSDTTRAGGIPTTGTTPDML